ncbi:putative mitochondrial protein [Cucumis melo var. makuwa]|uniref:Mitochondrial protein n=1 Tax=Cucumis melo var. makuwa TaxID=1194695 RepID=A0A5D3E4A6_CUCMM|nr:putative mitochondrial protein [Cucumis melo var. makuwa]TYK30115.1 putative mitochondrial protein [Cucumis melo var. makuwa]
MDVKNVLLNGTLSEEVYMKPPSGTTPPPLKVCLLHRALYGLKQDPQAWFATFSYTITQLGFTSYSHDSALFTRQTSSGIVLLLLYVDDMIITDDDPQAISDLQCYLDIPYAVHIVSQFMAAPRTIHFTVVLRILRYVKGTLGHMVYSSPHSPLLFSLNSLMLIGRVTLLIEESEYRALDDATSKLLWLRWLLIDMTTPQRSPTILHCDNRSAIRIAYNDVFHERTKHIENDCHFVHHHLHSNTLHLKSISTTNQPAHIFTKALHAPRFTQLLHKLKVVSNSRWSLLYQLEFKGGYYCN